MIKTVHPWFIMIFLGFLLVTSSQFFTANSGFFLASAHASTPDEQCSSCHQQQVADWQQSDHFHAMEVATVETSLGKFDGSSIDYLGHQAKFSTDSEHRLWVDFIDESGQHHHLNILYTFGYQPLQQYLFDAGNGRWQFIPFAWDSRAQQDGGQRWFVVHPDQAPNDTFHWTQPGQNWNQMCADCHVTDYQKNYDDKTKRYQPQYSALNVSCNACHGDESKHIQWAKGDHSIANKGYDVNIKQQTPVFHKNKDGKMEPVQPLVASKQIETCATCHARRSQLADRHSPQDIVNAFMPSLLSADIYYPDGQISDEVYVWGSFMQSKMHEQGVTCTNCHNPHSGKLKLQGNQTCTQCHTASDYDSDAHHKHGNFTQGNQCVDCHMPAKTYMQVDPRRDHSFKVPRPDLTLSTGSPNACNACHQDNDAAWSLEQLKKWYPQSAYINAPHYATIFHQADHGALSTSAELSKIAQDNQYPDIVRASALERMATLPDNNAMVAITRAIKETEPLKRLGAIAAAQNFPIMQKWQMLSPLLQDNNLSVRTEAARTLAPVIPDLAASAKLTPQERSQLNEVLNEYKKVQQYQSDRGFAHVALGNLAINLNRLDEAEQHFKKSIEIEPIFIPAYVNLADVYRQKRQEQKAQDILVQALNIAPENASIYYAQAMSYVRNKQKPLAIPTLEKAIQLAPDNVDYRYTYSLLLKDQGQKEKALKVLREAYAINQDRPDLAYAITQNYLETNNYPLALYYAKELQRLLPNNPQISQLINQIEDAVP
ncbi:tetratricopeptide repeat protein [Vibrio aphrogenes]|uniref:tetratricopeptide repeat protein n=1 Tax=Vibrio aphrogenes TaxID=1891186 RepID=UPI001E5F9E6D|nr:tetratricopeptide repeat protein [Vibrio aphrogenes]